MNLEIITLILMLIIFLLGLILAIINSFSSKKLEKLEKIALILMLITLLLGLILTIIDSLQIDADPLNFLTIVLILGIYGTVRKLIDKIKEKER